MTSVSRIEKLGITSNEWGKFDARLSQVLSALMHEKEQRVFFIRDDTHGPSAQNTAYTVLSNLDPAPDVMAWELFMNDEQHARFLSAIRNPEAEAIAENDELRPYFDRFLPAAKLAQDKGIQQIIADDTVESIPEEMRNDRFQKDMYRLASGDKRRAEMLREMYQNGQSAVMLFGGAHCFGVENQATSHPDKDVCERLSRTGIEPIVISFVDSSHSGSKSTFQASVVGQASSLFGSYHANPNLSDIYLIPDAAAPAENGGYMAVDFKKFVEAYKSKEVPEEILQATGLAEKEKNWFDWLPDFLGGKQPQTPAR